MEERIQKDSRGSFVVFTGGTTAHSYKEKMLQNNSIDGMLSFLAQDVNQEHQLWYETTGKQALSEYYRQNAPGVEELQSLLSAMDQLSRRLEEYLLVPEELVLTLEHIYVEDRRYFFLYLPDEAKDLTVQLTGLMEQLMERMDYENRQAVSLVYLLYARCRQENCTPGSLRKLCDGIVQEEAREARELGLPDSEEGCVLHEESHRESYWKSYGEPEEEPEVEAQDRRPFVLQAAARFFEKAANILHMGYHAQEVAEEETEYGANDSMSVPSTQDTILLSGGDTVLLTSPSKKQEQVRLEPLESDREIIFCTGFPFHFGKEETVPGHTFSEAVISRRHARIRKEAEEYYLIDEGSLNGTFLNGERLKPKECRRIVPGDILGFADIFYIFACPADGDVI